MAHTYGAGGRLPASGTTTTSNPVTVSLNLPSGTTVLWVGIVAGGTTARAGGALTFNGVALSSANAKTNAGGTPETCAEDWFLLDPPTGASYTLSIPNSGALALTVIYAHAKAATGKTSVFDNEIATPGNSTNPSTSMTVADGAIWFGLIGNGAQTWAPTARSGTQIADWDAGSWGPGAQYGIKSGTGSQTVSWTFGTSEDWVILATSFKEADPPSSGSGTPAAQSATASGSGTSASSGTGTQTAQSASASGSGTSRSTGTGALAAQSAALAGSGASASTGTGALTAQSATAAGNGSVQSAALTGSGALSANAAQTSGAGQSASTGIGALEAGQAATAGAGATQSAGTGLVSAQSAGVAGAGASEVAAAGALVADAAMASGNGLSSSAGAGELTTSEAAIAGLAATAAAGEVTGTGDITAGAAALSGVGTAPGAAVEVGGSARRPRKVPSYGPAPTVWNLPEIKGTGALVASEGYVAGRATLGETLAQKRNRKTLAMLMAA